MKNVRAYSTSKYGLRTYNWGAKTFLGRFAEKLTSRNNFDSNHRISAKLYSYNYFFYTASGFKVEFQEKKSKYLRINLGFF